MRWFPKTDFTRPPRPSRDHTPPLWPWVVGLAVLVGLVGLFVLAVAASMSQMGG